MSKEDKKMKDKQKKQETEASEQEIPARDGRASSEKTVTVKEAKEKTSAKVKKQDDTALQEKEEQYKELADKYLRLAAEYDNYRRRTQKEKDASYANTVVDVAKLWLPVLDNIERGIEAGKALENEESQKVVDGLSLIHNQVLEVMTALGIEEIEALGQAFDPEIMEAVMHCQDENCGENEVAEVLTKGYIRGEKVLRFAVVKVAN